MKDGFVYLYLFILWYKIVSVIISSVGVTFFFLQQQKRENLNEKFFLNSTSSRLERIHFRNFFAATIYESYDRFSPFFSVKFLLVRMEIDEKPYYHIIQSINRSVISIQDKLAKFFNIERNEMSIL